MNAAGVNVRAPVSSFLPSPKWRRGASLIVCLIMLIAVSMLSLSAAQIALQEEKASRNDRGRQIALHAAEAALRDAEWDIEFSARSEQFEQETPEGLVDGCGHGLNHPFLGLCRPVARDATPVWQKIDDPETGRIASVPLGHFTGRTVQTGAGTLPIRPPRYLIEIFPQAGTDVQGQEQGRLYRVSAIGFGEKESTQAVLQIYYWKKAGGGEKSDTQKGRIAWREILNWQELRDAFPSE